MFTLDPCSKDFLDSLEFILKVIGGMGGLYIFFAGLRRYTNDQIWRRNEFVAKEIKEFQSDRMAINAMQMIDWGQRKVRLFPEKEKIEDQFVMIDRIILKKALLWHELLEKEGGKMRFTDTEAAVRDTFDHFFSYFERYCAFIESGLVTERELRPYLHYWVNAITVEIDDDLRNVIYHYIDKYRYKGTQGLFRSFGKEIVPVTDVQSTLQS